jgi:O-antigen/teichoic acid export membrane protein
MEPSARIVRGGFVVVATYLIMMVLNVIFTIAMLRFLGDEGYGIFGVGMALFSILQGIAVLGIPTAAVRYIAKFLALKDITSTKKVLRTSVKYLIISSAIFSAALALLAQPIASWLYHNVNYTNAFLVVAAMLPAGILIVGLTAFFQGFQRMKYYLYVQTSWSALRLFISIALVLLGFFATGALLGVAIGMSVACVLGFLLLPGVLPKVHKKGNKADDIPREMLSTAAPVWVASIGGLFLLWYPVLLMGSLLAIENAGYYFACLSLIMLAILFSRSISVPLFPAVSELWTLKDKKRLELTVRTALKLVFIVLLPLATCMAVFSGFILTLVGGGVFIAGSTALSLLSIALIFQGLEEVNDTILCGVGKPHVFAKIYWMGVGSTIAVTTPLVFLYGINGAALGYLVAMVLITILGTYYVKRLTKLKYNSPALLRIALADVVMIIFLLALRSIVTSVPYALLVGGVGVLVYMAALLLVGAIEKRDVEVLRHVSKEMGEPSLLIRVIRFLDRHSQ